MKAAAVLLGPTGVGLIGILQNLMATASTVASMGFGSVGTRQIAEANGNGRQEDVDTARRALFWGTLFLAITGAAVFWGLRTPIATHVLGDPDSTGEVGWMALGVALTVASGSQRALLNGMRRIGDIARVQVYSAVVGTAVGVGALYVYGREGLLLFILVAPAASFVFSHVYVAKLPRVQSEKSSLVELGLQWKTLARLGFAFMVAGVVTTVGQLLVRSMIQTELGSEQLGYFQASWTISMTYIGFILAAMGTDFYPRLTAVIKDHEQAKKLVNEQTEIAILLAGPVLLAMLTLAPWILTLLYSEEFKPAASVLRWQILGDVLKVISWPLGFIILASGDGRLFMLTESIAMAVFVLVTWICLPLFGIEASGIGFFLMYLVYLSVVFWFGVKRIRFKWSIKAKRNLCILLVLIVTTTFFEYFYDSIAFLVGVISIIFFGIFSIYSIFKVATLPLPFRNLVLHIKNSRNRN